MSSLYLLNIFLHIDKYLASLSANYGQYVYLFLFLTIFMETGVVVTPFLPGDSLLFATGALAASSGTLNGWILFFVISAAAILGDSANYQIGKYFGPRAFSGEGARLFRKEYLEKTEKFYAEHGDKAIVLGRFFPIIRTFIPFVAGVGSMNYRKFLFYNIIGGLLWSSIFLSGGFLFGNIEIVKNNFSLVVFIIILLSLAPALYGLIKAKKKDA